MNNESPKMLVFGSLVIIIPSWILGMMFGFILTSLGLGPTMWMTLGTIIILGIVGVAMFGIGVEFEENRAAEELSEKKRIEEIMEDLGAEFVGEYPNDESW